jgi:hypothetical protein
VAQGSTVVAIDKDTGKELWRALTAKEPGYCPPLIIEAGGKRQLIVWHPEAVNSLDPDHRQTPLVAAVQYSIRHDHPHSAENGDLLYLTCFYNGSTMLRLDANQRRLGSLGEQEGE